MAEIPQFRRYAKTASQDIVAGRERRRTADELYDHASSLYDEAIAAGAAHEDAVSDVLARLSSPAAMSRDLGKAHRSPVSVRAILLIVIATVGFVVCLIGLYGWFFAINR